MKKCICALMFVASLFSNWASATLLEYTYTSASEGVIGSFVMDDSYLDGNAFQFVSNANIFDLNFSWGTATFTIADLVETDSTIFSSVGTPTVVGGAGFLANNNGAGLWVADTYFLLIGNQSFFDGSWTTTVFNAEVPEPTPLLLLAFGLLGLGVVRKKIGS